MGDHQYPAGRSVGATAVNVLTQLPYGLLGIAAVGILGMIVFLATPLSNVLNVVTVPLGYEWQSCPYCPDFGVEKITYTECANCSREITENFSRGRSPAGESTMYHFCSNDCYNVWNGDTE